MKWSHDVSVSVFVLEHHWASARHAEQNFKTHTPSLLSCLNGAEVGRETETKRKEKDGGGDYLTIMKTR